MKHAPQLTAVRHTIQDVLNRLADHIRPIALVALALLTLPFLSPAAHAQAQALTVVSVNFYNSEADARADTDATTTATNSDTVYVRVVFSEEMKNANGVDRQSPRMNQRYTNRNDNMVSIAPLQVVAWDADFLAERTQCQAIARPPQTTYICQLALDSTEYAASPLALAIFIKADGNTVTNSGARELAADYLLPDADRLTLTALAPQNPPTGITLVAGDRQIDVSWTAVTAADDGGSPITGYIATATDNSNNTFPCTATGATATTCIIIGLTNGTLYRVTVLATNSIGNGPASAAFTARPATPPTAAPTGVTLFAADTIIIVSWNTVATINLGGSPLIRYTATATEVGNDANTFSCDATPPFISTCDITRLTNGTEYRVTVLATNLVGNGPASAPLTATPMPATAPTTAPAGVTVVVADTEIIVSWNVVARIDSGGSDITGYIATATDTTDNNNIFTCETTRNSRIICLITDLTNGTEYRVTVQATNRVGNGPASTALTVTPRPAPTDTPQAQIVAADFALKPAAIAAGGSFRLLFVTTENITALSSDISIYNAHVQTSAAGGHSAIQPFSGEFRALVSSSVVDARDNTATNHVSADPNAPIYWLNGDQVAADYANFYDGEWDSVAGRDRDGNSYSFTSPLQALHFIWTGSNSDGTKDSNGNFIGTDAPANGRLLATDEINQIQAGNTTLFPLYALSPILTVGNNVATLSALSVTLDDASTLTLMRSDGSTTGFDTDERTYTATAPSGTIMVTMAATVADSNASVQYAVGDPASASFTDSGVLTVAGGNNTLTVRVTAEDDVTTQDYTITLTVQANTDATLSALSVTPAGGSALTLTRSDGNAMGFDSAERTYTATVLSAVDTVTVSATATDTSASIQYAVGDPASASFTNSGVLTVAGGESTLIARVTAEDGVTTQDYTITLTAPANTDATLNALSVKPVGDSSLTLTRPDGITMGFDTDELTYTATAPFGTTMVTVAAMATDSNASVQYAVGDPSSATFTGNGLLTVNTGESTLTASVTAEDGTTTRDYTITLTVPAVPNSNANLSALSVTPIDGSELILMQSDGNTGFDTNELTYTATAPFGTTMVTVAAMATDSNASVQYAVGNPASAMFTGNGLLTVDSGESTLTVSVTAEDGTTTRDYIIILTVQAMPNTDASLSALSVRPVGGSALTLTQSDGNTTGFDTANSTYTATASNETTITVTVAATATDSRASVQYAVGANPANNAFNSSGDLTVNTGENILTVRVTAEDDVTTRDYTITLTLTVTEGLLFKIKVFLEGAQ